MKNEIQTLLGLHPTEYFLQVSEKWTKLTFDDCTLADYNIQKDTTLDIKPLHPISATRVGLRGGSEDDNLHDGIDERLEKAVSQSNIKHELQLQEKSDEELEFLLREKSVANLLAVMKDFKVTRYRKGNPRPRNELMDSFLKERKDGFPLLRWSLMTRAEKEADRKAKRSSEKKREENAQNAQHMAQVRANETTEEARARLDANAKSMAQVRAKETEEETLTRRDKDARQHAQVRADEKAMNVHKWPTLDTLLGDTPGKDYKVEFHTEDVTAALFLFYLETGGWMYRESMWLIAYIHVIKRLKDDDDIRRLSNLLELCVEQHLSLQKVLYQAVLDDNDLKQVCKWKGQTEERQLMDKKEAVLEWFATSDNPISLDDRKAKLRAPEEVDTEERNKLIESLVGLHLNVPAYWWKEHSDLELWKCEVDSINLEEKEGRYFNIKCLDHDPSDPHQEQRYEMAYIDVKKYADREHPEYSDFYLPKTLDESRVDLKFKDRCEKTLQELRKLDRGKALLIQYVF